MPMLAARLPQTSPVLQVHLHDARDLSKNVSRLETFVARQGQVPLSRHPAWLTVLQQGLQHTPYCLEAVEGDKTRGILALAYIRSFLFGRFLVSLPYLNYGGVLAEDDLAARQLIDRAVGLADQLKVRFLELRHVQSTEHPSLNYLNSSKVHMRMTLPASTEKLWQQISAKVRNQVRKGQKSGLAVTWGTFDVLPEFYSVFSHNMRDLGTPVYGERLFRSILHQFPGKAEICVVRAGKQAVAAALLLHGWGVCEVPSASSLREFNPTCANMLMYWQLLERAVHLGHTIFDFGRCSPDSPTFRFKKQWGALPQQAVWQYYLRQGTAADMRPDNPRYQRLIRIWQRLPVRLTRLIGPSIVRGIP
jgi:FemAB-related protein (PEP-CTERM system-associated)